MTMRFMLRHPLRKKKTTGEGVRNAFSCSFLSKKAQKSLLFFQFHIEKVFMP